MIRYIVWTSSNGGEFVKAHKINVTETEIQFIRVIKEVDTVVKSYKKSEVKEYHEAIS